MKYDLKEKFKEGMFKFSLITVFSALVYTTSLWGLVNIVTPLTSPALKSKQHAEQFIKKEQKKLMIEDKGIELVIKETEKNGYAIKIGDNQYAIAVNPKCLNEGMIKHEIYHIADGHCDAKLRPIPFLAWYTFYYEPQAALYSAFGIKL